MQTIIVVAMTSNLWLAEAPGNVLCHTRETKLPRDSVINVSQPLTVDKSLLTERLAVLPTGTLRRVEDGLTPLVGREHEVGLLRERWAQSRDGLGQARSCSAVRLALANRAWCVYSPSMWQTRARAG
jgi:hypothetical protein